VQSQVSPAIAQADSAISGKGAGLRFRVKVQDPGSLMKRLNERFQRGRRKIRVAMFRVHGSTVSGSRLSV
jgi:hypothetical protein